MKLSENSSWAADEIKYWKELAAKRDKEIEQLKVYEKLHVEASDKVRDCMERHGFGHVGDDIFDAIVEEVDRWYDRDVGMTADVLLTLTKDMGLSEETVRQKIWHCIGQGKLELTQRRLLLKKLKG